MNKLINVSVLYLIKRDQENDTNRQLSFFHLEYLSGNLILLLFVNFKSILPKEIIALRSNARKSNNHRKAW